MEGHVHFDPGGRATQLAGVAVGDEAAQLSVLDALLDVMGWQPTRGQGVLVRFCRRSGGGNGNRVSMPQIVSCFIAFPSLNCTQTVSWPFLRFAEFMGKSFSFLYHTCIDHLFYHICNIPASERRDILRDRGFPCAGGLAPPPSSKGHGSERAGLKLPGPIPPGNARCDVRPWSRMPSFFPLWLVLGGV